jgi:hypothetical protein
VAVTAVGAFTDIAQTPVPVHPPPDQPENTEPEVAVAVSVTEVPELYKAVQVGSQFIPAGEDVTVPEPVPVLLMERVY